MLNKMRWILLVMLALLIFTGCSSDENESDASQNTEEKTEQKSNGQEEQAENEQPDDSELDTDQNDTQEMSLPDIEPIPTDEEGLAKQHPGPLAYVDSIYDMEEEIEEQLVPMSENPTDEEYENYLRQMYWLVAKDYPDPEDMIKKWEFASFGNPDLPDSKFHFKENYNIEIILDSSGSMANPAGDGTRMDVAKESINSFLSEAPEEANVSLRVYGHKGTSADSDKELSCGAIEQVYGFDSYDEEAFQEALNQFQPMGWTPLADALEQSEEALSQFDAENNTNLIYVVSDGIATCDGDPVAVAESLSGSNAQPIINIIGFQTDSEAQAQLKEMAEVSGGIFASAQDEEELQEEFDRAEEVLQAWNEWKDDADRDLSAMETDTHFDIMGLHNDWHFTTMETSNNLHEMLHVIDDLGLITFEQKRELQSRVSALKDEIDSTVSQLEEDLKKIREQDLQEARKSIEEKYSEGTENDS
ncbi:VWA domain-containing protein [Lentibacillus sediminis]|uniref:VWA domain-containing protein n=1 Tax=Lentibacillus sediminis TaxID=1940529 RepID=UPI000C1C1CAB|nr:VWA domain-containing protein [Lentibacillus sediminis]